MKGSLYTYFISERNFTDISIRCSSLLRAKVKKTSAYRKVLSEIKLVYTEPFIVHARANSKAHSSFYIGYYIITLLEIYFPHLPQFC